ncbi:MAG: hypothetical protein RSE62_03205 [Citrobacter sp.]
MVLPLSWFICWVAGVLVFRDEHNIWVSERRVDLYWVVRLSPVPACFMASSGLYALDRGGQAHGGDNAVLCCA